MSGKDVEQIADVVNGTKYDNHGSAAEEYYRYQLLKLKLGDRRGADTILHATSEKEEIEYRILLKISALTESSPEFAQVVDLTGTRDKFEMARRLAETVYDKVRAEQILGWYTPDKESLKSHFNDRIRGATQLRVRNAVAAAQNRGEAAAVTLLNQAFTAIGVPLLPQVPSEGGARPTQPVYNFDD